MRGILGAVSESWAKSAGAADQRNVRRALAAPHKLRSEAHAAEAGADDRDPFALHRALLLTTIIKRAVPGALCPSIDLDRYAMAHSLTRTTGAYA